MEKEQVIKMPFSITSTVVNVKNMVYWKRKPNYRKTLAR